MLAAHRAMVVKQEQALQRAKAEQQRAQVVAKRKMLLQKGKAGKKSSCQRAQDPDEGKALT